MYGHRSPINVHNPYQNPHDEVTRLVCIFLGVSSGAEALERFAQAALQYQKVSAVAAQAAREEELLRTEISAVQQECVARTGRGMPAKDAAEIVARRRKGEAVNVAERSHVDIPTHRDHSMPIADRMADMRSNANGQPTPA
jgi:hypothetical protein